eukprot:TRINITY_DN672_c0_g1_i3.p1 TRINITY_DN672_c0_g1~~TRINITY_DN672_c0_g1_i3.p1  ORF type:complete len:185 (-),score=9.93 TRINITY_DN672_c0_g1_i3:43-597(-)
MEQSGLTEEESQIVDELAQGIKQLEESWFNKTSELKSYLISPVHDAAAKGNVEGLKRIIGEGTPIDSRDAALNTPLHWSSGAGHLEAVKWLVQSKADLSLQNLLGDTALHRAVWRDQTAVVAYLVEQGIDLAALNKQGHKAIDLVRENVEIGALLQSHDSAYQEGLRFFQSWVPSPVGEPSTAL